MAVPSLEGQLSRLHDLRHHPLPSPATATTTATTAATGGGVLGVYQVWTHPAHRGRGLASTLIATAQSHAVYGTRLPQLAFRAPTRGGLGLALALVGPPVVTFHPPAAAGAAGGSGGSGGDGSGGMWVWDRPLIY